MFLKVAVEAFPWTAAEAFPELAAVAFPKLPAEVLPGPAVMALLQAAPVVAEAPRHRKARA